MVKRNHIRRSSNGRTPGSGPGNWGSSPYPRTIIIKSIYMTTSKRVRQVYVSVLISAFFACVYSLLTALSGKQEWISLFLMGVFLLVSIIALLYATMEFIITKEPTDLWKVGFLGLFGLLGLIPGFGALFGLFALFVYFGTREYF